MRPENCENTGVTRLLLKTIFPGAVISPCSVRVCATSTAMAARCSGERVANDELVSEPETGCSRVTALERRLSKNQVPTIRTTTTTAMANHFHGVIRFL